MGLPRWLTAVTLSLGVVFIIWLCLVIPQVVGNWTRDLWTEMNKSVLMHLNPPERPEAAHQADRQRQGDRGHAGRQGG